MGGGDQSEAHSALIHVDAHLILITKMQFPASQRRLMGKRLRECFFARRRASSRMDDFHAGTTDPQAHLFNRRVYDIHVGRKKTSAANGKQSDAGFFFFSLIILLRRFDV